MAKGLPDKLKAARLKLGMTQEQAAKAWGIVYGTLTRWEQGLNKPHGYALTNLNAMLDQILGAPAPASKPSASAKQRKSR